MTNYYKLKVGFQSDLVLHKVEQRNQLWQVKEMCTYYSGITKESYTIPKNYFTDLATIPKVFQWLLPPDGEYAWECCLHDMLYDDVSKGFMDRKDADEVFNEAMKVGKVSTWKRVLIYGAVRMFGGFALKYY